MLFLIVLLALAALLTYVSKFNEALVSVNFGFYTFSDIPLFYVIIGSLTTGLLLSYLLYLVDMIFTSWNLRSKDNEIKKKRHEILELTKRIHQLELENERIKNHSKTEPKDKNAL